MKFKNFKKNLTYLKFRCLHVHSRKLAYRKVENSGGLYSMIFINFPIKIKGEARDNKLRMPFYTFKVINFRFETFKFAYTVFFQVSLSKSLLT